MCETDKAAYEAERRWILHYGSNKPGAGYNVQDGGTGGYSGPNNGMYGRKHSTGARKKMYSANLGRTFPPRTARHKHAISLARRGEKSNRAFLSEAAVAAIKEALQAGTRQAELARQFHVSAATVSRIARGKVWRHVKV